MNRAIFLGRLLLNTAFRINSNAVLLYIIVVVLFDVVFKKCMRSIFISAIAWMARHRPEVGLFLIFSFLGCAKGRTQHFGFMKRNDVSVVVERHEYLLVQHIRSPLHIIFCELHDLNGKWNIAFEFGKLVMLLWSESWHEQTCVYNLGLMSFEGYVGTEVSKNMLNTQICFVYIVTLPVIKYSDVRTDIFKHWLATLCNLKG